MFEFAWCCSRVEMLCTYTHPHTCLISSYVSGTTTTTTIVQSGEAPFQQARSLQPTLGELKHALSQAGGPTQSQLSRPMSSRPHISMLHQTLIQMLENKKTPFFFKKKKKNKIQEKERIRRKKRRKKKGRKRKGKEGPTGCPTRDRPKN